MFNKLSIGLLAAMLFFILSCGKKTAEAPPPPRPYPVVDVSVRDITVFEEYPASIQGKTNNDVRAKIQGYIKEVYVDEGQSIARGQRLFRLETNMLNQAAQANQSAIDAAAANILSSQAAVDAAKVEADKLRPLVEKGIISSIQLQTAEANLSAARARLNQAMAAKAQAAANLQSTQANINYALITAPISGTIGTLPFKVGSLVGPTDPTPLTTISDTKELYAYFAMNESEYLDFLDASPGKSLQEKIKNFPKVSLRLANGATYSEKGTIETATGQIDPSTGTIQFRALFHNPNGLLTNGNTGVISVPKTFVQATVVPESATIDQQGNITVFKVDKDTARATIIQLVKRADNLAIVSSGLSPGDKIVAQGVGSLQNGTPITPQAQPLDSLLKQIKPVFK
jgi:membrane fusion protein (multidrug efflux system)